MTAGVMWFRARSIRRYHLQTKEPQLSTSIDRVRQALLEAGTDTTIHTFDKSTHTAEEAARAVGCALGQIVKSLVFVAAGQPVLLLVSGANRVDVTAVGKLFGCTLHRPDANTVKTVTGFSIGGVPPIGHARTLRTFVDRDLTSYDVVWAAAGAPTSVFPISPTELLRITNGEPISVAPE